MKSKLLLLALLGAAMVPAPAFAQSAEAMLDAAIASGDVAAVDAIAKYSGNNPVVAAKVKAFKDDLAAKAAAEKAAKMQGGILQNWTGSGEVGAFQSSGNTSATGVTLGVAAVKEAEVWRLKFRALADYQRTNGITSREQGVIALEPNYKINDRLYAFGLAQAERDKFQGFSSRFTLSGGLGYQVIKNERMVLDVKAGPAWRKTNFTTGGSDSSLAGLGAANFAWKLTPSITFTEDASAYIQSGNSSYSSVTGLNAKLSDAITARLSHQLDHETNPPAGLKKTDSLSRVTIIYGF
jgi:putative salt-induced outer membrane protein